MFLLADVSGLSMTGSLYEVDDYGRGEFIKLKNLILPAITLGIRPLSVIVQLTRNSLLEVLKTDYMRTAIAKGLSKTSSLANLILIFSLVVWSTITMLKWSICHNYKYHNHCEI